MDFLIDPMRPEDYERVREIYLEGLATRNSSFETEAPTWDEWNHSHHVHSRLVMRRGEEIVAWAALSPVSSRRCYSGVAEISFYVTRTYRGRGVGGLLLRVLIDSSEQNGIWTLFTSTFAENTASLRLQEACGFRVIGRRERIARLHGVWRDTIILERRSRVVGVN